MSKFGSILGCLGWLLLSACSGSDDASPNGGSGGSGPPTTNADGTYGEAHEGQYHLGPVDFGESKYHNACAPGGGYRSALQAATGLGGEFIAGVSNEFNQAGGVCDACILIETATGHSIVARVVTYGVEQEPGDIDVSLSVFEAINEDEFPRSMTWRFAHCPDVGPLVYEFQTAANPFWTSLWVRNPAVPLAKVEVQSANHSEFFALRRESDGTLNDDGGFGNGAFTLRMTGVDGQSVTESFQGFKAGELVTGSVQLD